MNILLNTNVSENKNTSKNISKNIVTSTTNRNTSKNISTSTSTSSNYKNTNKKLNFNSSPLLRSIKELHDKYPEDGWDKDIELLNNFDVTECPNAMFNTSNYYDDANKSCNNNNKSRNNNRNSCNSCNNDDNTNFINRKNYIKSMHRMKHFVLRTYFYYDDEKSMGRKTVWRRNPWAFVDFGCNNATSDLNSNKIANFDYSSAKMKSNLLVKRMYSDLDTTDLNSEASRIKVIKPIQDIDEYDIFLDNKIKARSDDCLHRKNYDNKFMFINDLIVDSMLDLNVILNL